MNNQSSLPSLLANAQAFLKTLPGKLPPDSLLQPFVRGVIEKYIDFNGRASIKEFWLYAAIAIPAGVILSLIPILGLLALLALLPPSLAVLARRMHDLGKQTGVIVLAFIPIVGLITLYWATQKGIPTPNEFGPPPRD